ncbi:hypothetical protein CBS14141_003651 [Malassezia furfur]|nr:hypothetical protein CBS14141_003651 [Malassezia furfur]
MVEQQTGGASTPAAAAHASFHDLYEQLERAYHTQPPSELQALLEQRLPQLRACGAALPTRSAGARAALDKDTVRVRGVDVRVDDVQRELARAISDRFDVDECEALALLRTFLESEHRALDTLGTARGADGAFTEFLDAFTVFFFEEQLAVIRCISALLRISEDAQNELYAMAHAVLDQFADASFATQVLAWFERETQEALPPAIRNDVRYTLLWARQGLCKQLALLEVVFLLYYGRLQPTAAFTLAALRAIQRTQFGQRQANAGFLDVPSSVLVECVAHLLLFLAIECLNLEAALEPLDGVLDGAASLVYYAPLLLGYALLLRRLDERLEAAPDARLAEVVAVHDGGAPMWRRLAHGALDPSMDLFGVLHALLASPLLGGTDSAVLGASDLSALAYRAVFKGLLLSLTELVQPEYLGDYDALVRLYGAAFGAGRDALAPDAAEGVASLCLQFWTADLPHETRASTLTTARRRFPASFLPLVQLAYALSGNAAPDAFRVPVPGSAAAEASAATLDYLAQLPTLALVLRPARRASRRTTSSTRPARPACRPRAALLTHLEDDDAPDAPRLVAIALDLLRVALPQAPIPTRLVCAAYRIVQRVLPLQPNEVWQRIRSSNVVLGSPGAVPLRASQASLSSAHAGAFSRLLDAEVRTGTFAGTLALLDLLNALVDEVLRALYTDAPALLAVKSEVLVRAVQWVADAVWPAYQRWTYAVARESFEIGRRCVRLFTRLCEEPHLPPAMQPLAALVDTLFGAQCAAARLRPLLAALATSDAEIAALYRAGTRRAPPAGRARKYLRRRDAPGRRVAPAERARRLAAGARDAAAHRRAPHERRRRPQGRAADAPRAATALQLAIDGMAIATELWDSAPRLLDALLQFLGVAWAHAYEHATAFRPLHADTQLLDALGTLLARPTEPVPVTPASQDAVADAPIALDDAADAVQTWTRSARRRRRRARILRTLIADAPQFARRLCAAFATDVEAPHAIEEHLEALVPSVPLAPLRKPPHADAFDARRTFGCAYVFAREAYLEKLYFLPEDVRHDATVLISSASLAWSRADAQARARGRVDRVPRQLRHGPRRPRARERPASTRRRARLARGAARGVLEQAVDVPRDAPPAALVPRVRVAAVLLAAAWSHGAPASFDETVALLATLLEHPAYADAPSALGTPLAELVLVACAAARRAAPDAHAPPSPALAAVAVRALGMLSGVAARAALYAPGSADAHAADTELQVLVAAVQHAAHRPRLAAAWAAPLRDARVLTTCLTLLARAPRAPLDGEAWAPVHVLYLAPLLQLCATLAAQRATCELLAESGVVFALCSNALSAELEQGTLAAALPTGDINPLHAHWLVALQIVASLTETLATSQAAAGAHFVEGDACAFVQLYAPQLRRTLHYTLPTPNSAYAAPPLDLAQLHEFRAVLRVLYAMHRAKARTTPLPLHAELVERLPWVLQQLGYLYTHPRELRTLLGLPEHADAKDGAGADADADWQAVVPLATDALADAIATLLALLWDLSGASVVLLEDVAEWPVLPALIAPVLHTTPSSPASLGTLLEIASALSDAARACSEKDARRAMLGTALAQSIGLCATQAVLWARGPLPPDASDACRAQTSVAETEIASGLGRDVDAAIRAAQGACTPDERVLLDVLHRFSQQYLGASRSE